MSISISADKVKKNLMQIDTNGKRTRVYHQINVKRKNGIRFNEKEKLTVGFVFVQCAFFVRNDIGFVFCGWFCVFLLKSIGKDRFATSIGKSLMQSIKPNAYFGAERRSY
jgi:hypothetical protein